MSRCSGATAVASAIAAARLNELPLGAGALAGTAFPIDRVATAKALGFDRPAANSLDAVSDRDFALEFLAAAAIAATHLSRFAEEIVLWPSEPFRFIRLSDAFTTGSSIMPQKRNPDAAELVRAKAGRVAGALVGLLAVMKGLPLAYARTCRRTRRRCSTPPTRSTLCLAATAGMVARPEPDPAGHAPRRRQRLQHRDRSRRLAGAGLGLPFREAHHVTGAHRRARRGAGLRSSPRCRSARCRGSSRASPPPCSEVLDVEQLGREPHQLRRHRARQCRRRRRRGRAKRSSCAPGMAASRAVHPPLSCRLSRSRAAGACLRCRPAARRPSAGSAARRAQDLSESLSAQLATRMTDHPQGRARRAGDSPIARGVLCAEEVAAGAHRRRGRHAVLLSIRARRSSAATALRRRLRRRRGALCYSMKANSNLAVSRRWRGSARAPTSSRKASSAARSRPASRRSRIVFSGVGKTEAEIAFALAHERAADQRRIRCPSSRR